MTLYLCRHGEALPGPVDAERELSAEGQRDVETVATFLGAAGVRVERVAHSGFVRARQTADILAAAVAPNTTPEAMEGLLPEEFTDAVAWQLRGLEVDTLLVGHMPFLGRLVSRLVVGDEEAAVVRFRAGVLLALEPANDGWALRWMVTPQLLQGR